MGANSGVCRLALVAAIGFALAGCGSSGPPSDLAGHGKSRGYYKVGAPYQVNGVWYFPKVDYDYDEKGTASWYGEAFQGKPTANGEIFDLNRVTAAHKTLQLPSVVEVTNLRNGRSLRMRVNDRGPFVGDRIIDLSRRAAQLLGFEGAGTAPVRVRILKEESIKVAEAAMRGDIGQTMVASVTRAPQARLAAAEPAPAARAISIPAVQTAPGPEPASSAPSKAPAPASPAVAIAAPLAPPPITPQPQIAAPHASPPVEHAVARSRPWPSLIASAHAAPIPAAARLSGSAASRQSGRIFVQAGAFSVPENAQRVRARVASLARTEVTRTTVNGADLYRVRLGPVVDEAEARRLLSRVVESGYPGARVVDD